MIKCENDIAGKLLRLLGIRKCHYCKKCIFPWQSFVGHFGGTLRVEELELHEWNHYTIDAKWLTHKGNCTEMDIKNAEKRQSIK